jgi:hypothetical protein
LLFSDNGTIRGTTGFEYYKTQDGRRKTNSIYGTTAYISSLETDSPAYKETNPTWLSKFDPRLFKTDDMVVTKWYSDTPSGHVSNHVYLDVLDQRNGFINTPGITNPTNDVYELFTGWTQPAILDSTAGGFVAGLTYLSKVVLSEQGFGDTYYIGQITKVNNKIQIPRYRGGITYYSLFVTNVNVYNKNTQNTTNLSSFVNYTPGSTYTRNLNLNGVKYFGITSPSGSYTVPTTTCLGSPQYDSDCHFGGAGDPDSTEPFPFSQKSLGGDGGSGASFANAMWDPPIAQSSTSNGEEDETSIFVYDVNDIITPGIYTVVPQITNNAAGALLASLILSNWGNTGPVSNPPTGDLNGDGVVNAIDLGIFLGGTYWYSEDSSQFGKIINYPGSTNGSDESLNPCCIINDWFTYAKPTDVAVAAEEFPYRVIRQTGFFLENDVSDITQNGFTATPNTKYIRHGIIKRGVGNPNDIEGSGVLWSTWVEEQASGGGGETGIQGIQGIQGRQGPQGVQGRQGPQGVQGSQGTNGSNGSQGIQGPQGIQGTQGPQGTQGTQGRQGTQGPQGTQGTQGRQGVQGFIGPVGPIGFDGRRGAQGIQGIAGGEGLQGRQGVQGPQGLQGRQGPQGLQGPQGVQGPQGLQGPQGVQGPQGLQGIQGPQGTQGIQGIQGLKGGIIPNIPILYNHGLGRTAGWSSGTDVNTKGVTLRFMGDAMNWTNFTFSFGLSGTTTCTPLATLRINPNQYLTLGKGTFLVVNKITQYKIWADECICVVADVPDSDSNIDTGPDVLSSPNRYEAIKIPVWARPWMHDIGVQFGSNKTPGYLPRFYSENQTITHMSYHTGETVLFPSAPILGINVTGGNTSLAPYYINPPGNSYGFVENPSISQQINPLNFPWDIPCITCQEKWNWGGAEAIIYDENNNVVNTAVTNLFSPVFPGEAGINKFALRPCPNDDPECLDTPMRGISLGTNLGDSYYRQFKYRGDRWVHNGYAIKISDQVITGWTWDDPIITVSSFGGTGFTYSGPPNTETTTIGSLEEDGGVGYEFNPGGGPDF